MPFGGCLHLLPQSPPHANTHASFCEHTHSLQVHWLRLILDEGHLLGASTSITNKLQMAIELRAERRWVMTGEGASAMP